MSSESCGRVGEVLETILDRAAEQLSSSAATTVLPWDSFSNWVHCICIVTFDLELGQAMEVMYPGHIKLSEVEKSNICYLAFPDSNSGCMGDTQFHFRMRQNSGRGSLQSVHTCYNQQCPVALQIDPAYYYGYVYFRQVKDNTLRRGYFQKSVVLITPLPFVNLFLEISGKIAPEYFHNGEPSIEAACHDIDQWPPPLPGETLYLPLLGNVLQAQIPSLVNKSAASPQTGPKPLPAPTVVPSVHEVSLFQCFYPVLSHLHMLWELVITAEPIVVMASSPTMCSEMVQALVSAIMPLRYCADFRPFFTIHDSEFKEYTTKAQAPPPVILGVTNPFFAKTLQHWPHIIRLGDNGTQASTSAAKPKLKKGNNVKMLDSKPGLYTHYRPFLLKDKAILKKLTKGIQTRRPGEVQTAMLRRHLLELTSSFMIPLERYMGSLMPLQKNISPYKAAPTPRPFNPDDFLATLSTAGPQLTSGMRGDWIGLYRRFFRSPNFSGWYNLRYREASQKLQALQVEALSDADLGTWIEGKQEVERIDMVLRLRQKLEQSRTESLPIAYGTEERLERRLNEMIGSLPDDLHGVLKHRDS